MVAGPFLLLVDNSITKETASLGLSYGSHAQKCFWSLCLHLFRYHSHVLPIGGENLPAKPLSIHTWALSLPCSSCKPTAGPPILTYHIPSIPWASHKPSAGPPTLTHPHSQHALGLPQPFPSMTWGQSHFWGYRCLSPKGVGAFVIQLRLAHKTTL